MDLSAKNLTYYYSAGASPTYFYGFGFGYTHHLAFVYCTGSETNLLNCSYSTDYFDIYYICDYAFAAGVRCLRGTEIDSVVEYSKWNVWHVDT